MSSALTPPISEFALMRTVPIGDMLIEYDSSGAAVLVVFKFADSVIVMALIVVLLLDLLGSNAESL